MTRDDIIRMAREAGHAVRNIDGDDEVMDGDNYHIQTDLIERFAALVAAAEREKVAAWMMQRGYATGHGDTVEDLLKELEWQVIEDEREACVKIAEYKLDNKSLTAPNSPKEWWNIACQNIRDAIRARGQS